MAVSESDETTAISTRLLISGGSHRATFGAIGAVHFLLATERWSSVREIVSVSGGSSPNAALLTLGDGSDDGTRQALKSLFERAVADGVMPWRTARRMVALVGAVVLTAAVVTAMSSPLWLDTSLGVFICGLLLVPVALQFGRRLAAFYTRDYLATITASRGVDLASFADRDRQHVFCAAGLSSATPYYFWAGGSTFFAGGDLSGSMLSRGRGRFWGAAVQDGYTVDSAVYASSALPGIATVRAPTASETGRADLLPFAELLVDGGVCGGFGDQIGSGFRRSPSDTHRDDPSHIIAIDASRHVVAAAGRLTGVSMSILLARWLKTSIEATYVNDLLDLRDAKLVRIADDETALVEADRSPRAHDDIGAGLPASQRLRLRNIAGQAVTPDPALANALRTLRKETAAIGLFGLSAPTAATAVTTGLVATLLEFEPSATVARASELLAVAGASLGLGSGLVDTLETATLSSTR